MKNIKMRYSVEPRNRIYVKGYGFLFFAKNMGKSLSNKYGQKLLDSAKKSTTDAIKNKRAIQKTAEVAGDLIGNKIADKITNVSRKSAKELPNYETDVDVKRATPKKRYISSEERQQIIEELRLVPKRIDCWWINVNFKRDTYLQKKDNKLLMNCGWYNNIIME